MRFKDSVALNGDDEIIWSRVSNVEEIPNYWPAVRSLEFVGGNEKESIAKIEFAFGGTSKARIMVDEADRTLLFFYTSGALTGTQRVSADRERLMTELDVKFHGAYRLLSRVESDRLRARTNQALKRLVAPEGDGT